MAISQTKRQSDLEKRLQILRRQVYGKDPEIFRTKPDSVRKTQTAGGRLRRSRESENQINQRIRNADTLTLRYSGSLREASTPKSSESFRNDTSYLYHDLLKILIFSSLAIAIQVTLFILLQNHILKLNFF